jgi:hypothetical protein
MIRPVLVVLSTTLVLLLLPFLLGTCSFPLSSFSFLASSSSSRPPQLRAAAATERQPSPAEATSPAEPTSIGDDSADATAFLVQDHPVIYPKNASSILSSSFTNDNDEQQADPERHLQQASGTRSVLVIRVMAADKTPSASIASLREYIFSHTNSLANQMNRCSAGTVTLVRNTHHPKVWFVCIVVCLFPVFHFKKT